MVVSNISNSVTIKTEMDLLLQDTTQQYVEGLNTELENLIALAQVYADDNYINDDSDILCISYKEISLHRERHLVNACNEVNLGIEVIASAYDCPRQPIYKFYLKSNRNIFKII